MGNDGRREAATLLSDVICPQEKERKRKKKNEKERKRKKKKIKKI